MQNTAETVHCNCRLTTLECHRVWSVVTRVAAFDRLQRCSDATKAGPSETVRPGPLR